MPKAPGVYQFIGEQGEILYIGKAKNLQNRLKSYFAKEIGRGPGIDLMVQQAKDIKIYETESEIEAVILEADLIGKIKPKYNIRQKDDKSFLAIKITKPKPRRDNRQTDNGRQAGDITPPNLPLKRGGISAEEVSCVGLVRFRDVDLSDKSAWYFGPYPSGEHLKKSMRYLRRIFPFRDCSDRKYVKYSSFGRQCLYGDIGICTGPCAARTVDVSEGEGILTSPGRDRVPQNDIHKKADEILEYQKNIKYFMDFLRGKKSKIIKDIEKEMTRASREKQFERATILRDRLRALGHLKDVAIGIKDDVVTPTAILFKRIECYDISNIQGQYAVGSMVVFEDGEPDKNEYRRFRIKYQVSSIEGEKTGDIQMMEEVLRRRFRNDWTLPNLVVIDGGLVHLNLARKILDELKLDIPVISIAKGPKRDKNEFHFSNGSVAQYFKSNFDLQKIAVRARDEAHRFAIQYYRKRHIKGMLES